MILMTVYLDRPNVLKQRIESGEGQGILGLEVTNIL